MASLVPSFADEAACGEVTDCAQLEIEKNLLSGSDVHGDQSLGSRRGWGRPAGRRSLALCTFAASAGAVLTLTALRGTSSNAMVGSSRAGKATGESGTHEFVTMDSVDDAPSTKKSEKKSAATDADENTCPGNDDKGSCLSSKCCKEPGYQCFAKNDFWAECMTECAPGPNLFDQGSSDPWSCKPLGDRAPGEVKKCSGSDENCLDTECCSGLGMQCYAKNATFGTCKISCEKGVDMGDKDDWRPWSCEPKGPRSRMPADWISKKCAYGPDNCAQSQCCGQEGFQCYTQNQYYGQCKGACTPTAWDKCNTVGPKTPELPATIANTKSTVGAWVKERCSLKWEDCRESKCCAQVGTTCYAKDDDWATCKQACDTELLDPADNKTWSCDVLGPKSWGLAMKGYPSLFCFSLYMPSSYEKGLLSMHIKKNAGIFQCDGYDVFAAENDTLGTTADGIEVKALLIPKIRVGQSQDGTAGNAKLFMAVWDKIIAGGRFRYYDWTVKVDPDAVLLPWRLRSHMAPHIGEKVYVVNCNKFPSSPNFPMMYGALEVFSQSAMLVYADQSWKCGTQLPWKKWGEDYYMTHCMDFIGVGRISDFGVLGDNMCVGANCGDSSVASFHPFKSVDSWNGCWDTANGIPPPPPPPPITSDAGM